MENRRELAPARSTEGKSDGTMRLQKVNAQRTERANKGGRPLGAKNKPKSLVPVEVSEKLLLTLRPLLPSKQFDYMKGVLLDGKDLDVERELDSLILLLRAQLLPAMVSELEGPPLPAGAEEELGLTSVTPEFRKDVTERIKVLKDLIDLKMKNERARDDGNTRENPIALIFANRGLAGDRLRIAIEHQSGPVGGSVDESGWEADTVGDVPVELSKRPISIPSRNQSAADRVVNDNLAGMSARSVHPE